MLSNTRFIFFFQAEDGIRDGTVTGVQTCALPICRSRWRTVRKAIGRLDRLSAGSRSKSDRLHRARALNCMNLERIKHTPAGGSWKDWPDRLRLTCHKKTS